MKILFTCLVVFCLGGYGSMAQRRLVFGEYGVTEKKNFRSTFKDYRLVTADLGKCYETLATVTSESLELELLPGQVWSFDLQKNDLLAEGYYEIVAGTKGGRKRRSTGVRTFSGQLKGRSGRISMTVDRGFFMAVIEDGNQHWYIEPAEGVTDGNENGLLMVYKAGDVVADGKSQCGFTETRDKAEAFRGQSHLRMAAGGCKIVDLAIASDAGMFAKYGSASVVTSRNIAIMNNVSVLYRHEFSDNIEFRIAAQYVSQLPAQDPLSSSSTVMDRAGTETSEPGEVLSYFRSWGLLGGFGTVNYDIAQLWTSRDFTGSVVGNAYVGTACTSWRFHVLQDYTTSYTLLEVMTAHEIGHNLNASHDTGPTRSIMTQTIAPTTTWAEASVNSIDSHLATRTCLAACDGAAAASFSLFPQGACEGGAVRIKDKSSNTASRTWVFPMGEPSSSAEPQQLVSYATEGSYDIELHVDGAAPLIKEDYVIVGKPGAVSPACPVVSGSPGGGGITRFALNEINAISGTGQADGALYVDRFCDHISVLEADRTYDLTIGLGASASAPAEWVKVYIDYNNDGSFNETNELVVTAASPWAGTVSYDAAARPWLRFSTPSQVLTNKLLRLRVITDQTLPQNACARPVSGQVEDFSIFFRTGGEPSLPVDLVRFSGQHKNGINELVWETVNESEMDLYEIQRSENGTAFGTIGSRLSVNSGKDHRTYRYEDQAMPGTAGGYYYRLKMLEKDGSSEYSPIVYIRNPHVISGLTLQNCETLLSGNRISYELVSDEPREIRLALLDRRGNRVQEWSRVISKGKNVLDDNLPRQGTGVYFLTIQARDRPVLVQKVIL